MAALGAAVAGAGATAAAAAGAAAAAAAGLLMLTIRCTDVPCGCHTLLVQILPWLCVFQLVGACVRVVYYV